MCINTSANYAYQLSRPIKLIYDDAKKMWNLRDVKVSNKDKMVSFGFLSSFTSFWSVRKMYIEKWEPLYSAHLALTNIFLRNHRCRLSWGWFYWKILVIAKHINWYIKLGRHWYKIRQYMLSINVKVTFWSPKRNMKNNFLTSNGS